MQTHPTGRSPLNWLVVNPDGKLLAVFDSESEADWFTRHRSSAYEASIIQAPIDYAQAPALLEALRVVVREIECYCTSDGVAVKSGIKSSCARCMAESAITYATV